MKTSELREMTIEELEQSGREMRRELFNLRLQQTTGQVENPVRIKYVRRDIARTETLLHERRKAEG